MSLAIVHSRALSAASSVDITVEVHLANGLPGIAIVGLPDTEVRESRERVRAALQHCGFEFPARRITVNLAPADLPKESGRFDLPIALGILVASGQLPEKSIQHAVFAGELSLTGALHPIRGAFAVACGLAAQSAADSCACPQLYLPRANALDAARVPGLTVFGAIDLPGLCAHLRGARDARLTPIDASATPDVIDDDPLDMADVIGQSTAKRALEVAAAGGHHLLMIGPPGAGKSMLASRLSGILPPMTDGEALASASLISSGSTQYASRHWRRRPFRAPHHSSSAAALVGGGNPPRPGEISLSHHGVLFLDELPEFDRRTLEMLREPLEAGRITISRSGRQAEFPAAFQLVAAMNPCPCGWAGDPRGQCRCTPDAATRYRNKLSGPLLDRIDIQLELAALTPREWLAGRTGARTAAETSATIRDRVTAARRRQLRRQGTMNTTLNVSDIERHCPLDSAMETLLERAASRFHWSARAHHRVLKVALTIADLDDCDQPESRHIAEAIQYRRAV